MRGQGARRHDAAARAFVRHAARTLRVHLQHPACASPAGISFVIHSFKHLARRPSGSRHRPEHEGMAFGAEACNEGPWHSGIAFTRCLLKPYPMRVLFITSAYPANLDDPRGTFIHVLARSLVEEGVQVTVLAPGSPGAPRSELRDGVHVRRATYWIPRWQSLATGLGGIVPNLRSKPWLIFQIPALLLALSWRAVRLARGADVIHAHWVLPSGLAGVRARRWSGRPLIITSHGGDLNLAVRIPALRPLVRRTVTQAQHCVGVSGSS